MDSAATAGEEEAGAGGTGEAVADTAAYDRGYEDCVTYVKDYSDERIASEIEKLRGHDTLTDYGRGWLEAMEYEQQERAQMGTGTAESAANSTGNAVSDAGNPAEGAGSVENVQESPQGESVLQRIPRDKHGELMFEAAETPEVGWDALVEVHEGNEADAKETADLMVNVKRKAFEKAQKLTPKGSTPSEIKESREKIRLEQESTKRDYEMWQRIAGVGTERQNAARAEAEAEARRVAADRELAEAEAARREAEMEAERKALAKIDKSLAETYDRVKGNDEARERLSQLDPETIYEAAALVLSTTRYFGTILPGLKDLRVKAVMVMENARSYSRCLPAKRKGVRVCENCQRI